MTINQEAVQKLSNRLDALKHEGKTPKEAVGIVHHEFSSQINATRDIMAAGDLEERFIYEPEDLATAVVTIYPKEVTPLSLAKILKSIYGNPRDVAQGVLGGFPETTAIEMGLLLLNQALFSNLILSQMKVVLESTQKYTESEINATLTTLYAQPIEANFSQPSISTQNCTVHTEAGTMFNSYYKHSWIMHYPGSSAIQIEYNHTKQGYSTVNLVMVHLTSMNGPQPGYSPIDILVNGTIFKSRYNVGNGNYVRQTFDITSLVHEGANTILLKFSSGASTNYWIQELKVDYLTVVRRPIVT